MTTIVQPQPATADDVLEAVAALAPAISERAPEIEDARRLPPDLLADLVTAGCFRMLRPRSHGGLELPLRAGMEVVEALSRADASAGWTVMIGAGTWLDLANLPRSTFDRVFADAPDAMVAGVFSPSGVAVPVEGGYRVSGRWAFASGSPHADWLYGNCIEEVDGGARLRIVLFELDDAALEDTWHVVGLRGTGSHHFHVDNVVVPAERTCAVFEDPPSVEAAILRVPIPSVFALSIGAMALGTARGALDEITAMAATKQPLLATGALATSPTFHHRLAAADAGLRAATALLHEEAEAVWATATAGVELTIEQRGAIRSAATHAMSVAVDAVTAAYRAGGGGSVYLDSALQRRLRDINTAAQHFLVRPDTLTTAGAVLAGQGIDVPIF